MDWNLILMGLGVPVARSVLGWLENAFADAKISAFEWSQLASTILRVGLLQCANIGLFGSLGASLDWAVIAGSSAALLQDIILKAIKKK